MWRDHDSWLVDRILSAETTFISAIALFGPDSGLLVGNWNRIVCSMTSERSQGTRNAERGNKCVG
jgi:hypothetical protein